MYSSTSYEEENEGDIDMYEKKTEKSINMVTILAVVGCFVLQAAGAYFALNWAIQTMKEVPSEIWGKVFSSIGVIAGMAIVIICEVSFLKSRKAQEKVKK